MAQCPGARWAPLFLVPALLLSGCMLPGGERLQANIMQLHGVRIDPRTSAPVILLQEQGGSQRRLPIWIGAHEARSISMGMESVTPPRPNSHDLIRNLVEGMKARLERVIVTELKGGTYYAVLELEVDGRTVTVDSRPSDAIAVATRMGVDVYATERVLRQAGIVPEQDRAVDIHWLPPDFRSSLENVRRH